jgi:hypothetical protein
MVDPFISTAGALEDAAPAKEIRGISAVEPSNFDPRGTSTEQDAVGRLVRLSRRRAARFDVACFKLGTAAGAIQREQQNDLCS